jgi:hypothetical protein
MLASHGSSLCPFKKRFNVSTRNEFLPGRFAGMQQPPQKQSTYSLLGHVQSYGGLFDRVELWTKPICFVLYLVIHKKFAPLASNKKRGRIDRVKVWWGAVIHPQAVLLKTISYA